MKSIILASNNKNKLREIKDVLEQFNINVISQEEAGYDIEVDETGTTFEENAILKAEAIYNLAKSPVISDDSGLEIDALNGEPGVYSKRYAGPNATDKEKIELIFKKMENIPDEKRTARFTCAICYIDEYGIKHVFKESCEGKILREIKGKDGFAYDPIFQYGDKTFAEISEEEKNKVSHRGKAIRALVNYFKNQK